MIKRYHFDNDFKKLSELTKELISLGSWSMYKVSETECLIVTDGGCPCCHGSRQKRFFLANLDGEFIGLKDKEFYDSLDFNKVEIIKFDLPERITKNYIKFSI